jgi:NAD(P)-dependent dehydrogenase (short-subunit alcohol dehydrogenase family)
MTQLALVTGSSRGLGRNTALSIARAGGDVIVTYQASEAGARAVVAEIEAMGRRAVALQLDVGDTARYASFTAELQRALQATWGRETFDCLVTWRHSRTPLRRNSTRWLAFTSKACSS